MPVAKLSEYRAPWETEAGEDAEIDKGKLKKYIHGLLVDKDRLQTSVTEVTTELTTLKSEVEEKAREGETETDRLKRELKESQDKLAKVPETSKETLQLRVALDKGLTAIQAKRLIGETEEELAKDADELVKSFGGSGQADEDDDSTTVRRQPRRLQSGTDPDPDADTPIDIDKALDLIPRIN